MSIIEEMEEVFSKHKKINSGVFLYRTVDWSSDGGDRVRWRLWSTSEDKLNSVAEKNGLDESRLASAPIPHCYLTESEAVKIKSAGIEEKKPTGFGDREKKQAEILTGGDQVKKSDGKFHCEKCGGLDGWFPRAPGLAESDLENWRCVECRPWNNPAIVAKRCGPLWEASEAERVIRDTLASANASQAIVVAVENVTCVGCKSTWVIERPGLDGVEWFCWSCQQPIGNDAFYAALNSKPRWRISQEARRLKASKRKLDAINEFRKKLAGKR